jgi:peptide/nickel transport system permease protein
MPEGYMNKRVFLKTFLVRRFFSMILVWVGISIMIFLIANVVPVDPVALRLGPKATPESVAYWRHQFGLDQPLYSQYLGFVAGIFKGDLGTSIWSGRLVIKDLADYLPGTIELALSAIILTIIIGIPLGVFGATRQGGIIDPLIQIFTAFGLALPLFWLGMLFQLLFYRQLSILPLDSRIDLLLGGPSHITGLYTLDSLFEGDWIRLGNSFKHLILPAVTLSLPAIGGVARMARASTLEVMSAEFVRTARSKGGSAGYVLRKHIVRNALIPVTTLLGNTLNSLLAGTFVVEAIFDWPGLGWYATKVILAADYGAMVSITMVIAITATFINLIVDILYGFLDPRIEFR